MKDAHGTTYEPWMDGEMVGYKITRADGSVRFLYFNPSDDDSDGKSNAFVYFGKTGDPAEDNTIIFVRVDVEAD